jgi:hypothetical protein
LPGPVDRTIDRDDRSVDALVARRGRANHLGQRVHGVPGVSRRNSVCEDVRALSRRVARRWRRSSRAHRRQLLGNWNGLPLSDLQKRIKTTMPSDTVGIYDIQLVTDVIAFVLRANGFPAGTVDLPKDAEPLKEIMIKAGKPDGQ